MIETVVKVGLPVDESLIIQKQRLMPAGAMEAPKRIAVVTGTHGDELEGQYVCYLLNNYIQTNRGYLRGVVDIYPALNPMGIDSISRGIPMFDLDMNRIFPGDAYGATAEQMASQLMAELSGADLCIDIHSSNIFLREMPQVRISTQTAERLLPYARQLNMDYIWIHSAATVLESTLAHSLNNAGTPTLVVEMGVGMRIDKANGQQLADGILAVMAKMGIWAGPVATPREPIISSDGQVSFINAEATGIFIPAVEHLSFVKKGCPIGEILDPLTGQVVHQVLSPCAGVIFTLREYPIVNKGSLIARILGGDWQ